MDLPVMPPVKPMLAKAATRLPRGEVLYEPKWDGFRSIIFRHGDEVEIGSRNERPMTRYFPELAAAVRRWFPERCVVDGEVVLLSTTGDRLDFEALQQRIHPADSRVALLSRETPVSFVAFDLLSWDDTDYMSCRFAERRASLEQALAGASAPMYLTPVTANYDIAAEWFRRFEGAGLDGIVAKPADGTYQPNKRVMVKVKHERTADCVLAGYRTHKSGAHRVGSLLLGLYDSAGDLVNVGAASAFSTQRREELFTELRDLETSMDTHPWAPDRQAAGVRTPTNAQESRWSAGKDLSFTPLRPERVVEVRYDHMEGPRFRHVAQFARWRPDRDPASCTYDQLTEAVKFDLHEVLNRPELYRS